MGCSYYHLILFKYKLISIHKTNYTRIVQTLTIRTIWTENNQAWKTTYWPRRLVEWGIKTIRRDCHPKVENCYLSVRDWNDIRIKLHFVVEFEWFVLCGCAVSFMFHLMQFRRSSAFSSTNWIIKMQYEAKFRIFIFQPMHV